MLLLLNCPHTWVWVVNFFFFWYGEGSWAENGWRPKAPVELTPTGRPGLGLLGAVVGSEKTRKAKSHNVKELQSNTAVDRDGDLSSTKLVNKCLHQSNQEYRSTMHWRRGGKACRNGEKAHGSTFAKQGRVLPYHVKKTLFANNRRAGAHTLTTQRLELDHNKNNVGNKPQS